MNLANTLFVTVLVSNFCFNLAQATEYDTNIREISRSHSNGINFDRLSQFDLNNDGYKDSIKCSPRNWIEIRSGKDNSKLFSWTGPSNKDDTHFRRYLSQCEVVKVGSRHVTLISNHARWKSNGWLRNSDQYVVYFNGSRFIWTPIHIEGFGKLHSASRRINCHAYPHRLVKLGYKPGALCFNSDYAADYYNRSALLKLEFSGNTLIFKDLSPSSGTQWRGGVRGTHINNFRVGSGFKSNQRDGAFMMGSAFLDYDRDGLVDFITVGQHASVRAHKITVDTSRAEGIRVTDSYIHVTSKSTLSELLNVKGFNDFDKRVNIPCFYTSGEGHEGGLSSEGDRVYCYQRGSWVRQNLPRALSSQYSSARIRPVGNGRMYIQVENRRGDNSVISRHLFDFYYIGGLKGVTYAWNSASHINLGGHACRQNASRGVTVKSYSLPLWSTSKVEFAHSSANISSGKWVQGQCMSRNSLSRNYRQTIARSSLPRGRDRAIYTYAIDNMNGAKKLLGVSLYTRWYGNGAFSSSGVKALPMRTYDDLTVTWTNKGSGWAYSLDVIDQNGNTRAPCQHMNIINGKTSFTLKDGKCYNNAKFSASPKSRVRICASPSGFRPGTAVCSGYRPLYGPKMHIVF